ncbi:MAG: hypothetical protein ACM3RP_08000 [Chitinophagales bacterium]
MTPENWVPPVPQKVISHRSARVFVPGDPPTVAPLDKTAREKLIENLRRQQAENSKEHC